MEDGRRQRILIVDDEPDIREIIERSLRKVGYRELVQAGSAADARKRLSAEGPFALVVLDVLMPGESGTELLHDLASLVPETVVIVATAVAEVQTVVSALRSGAYDYLVKPLMPEGVQLAVGRALRRRWLEMEVRRQYEVVEQLARERAEELEATRKALLKVLCQTAEFRDAETGAHLWRVPEYARILAEDLGRNSPYADVVTELYVRQLAESAPLHDIGKVAVPDYVLLKRAGLTPEEFELVKLHTVRGRELCMSVKEHLGGRPSAFINMAVEVTGSHHERWDGRGYPDGAEGVNIPLSGQIVHLADFYDACRSPRCYRPQPMLREVVVDLVWRGRGTVFGPEIVDAFMRTADEFLAVEEKFSDSDVPLV